jgi:sugar phosphate isomerase/epimerase
MTHFSFMIIEPPSALGVEIADLFPILKECGYAGVELNLRPELIDRLDDIETIAARNNLVIPSFLTGAVYGKEVCLSSPDPAARQAAVAKLIDYVPIAQRFDAILVVGLLQGFRSDEPDPVVANERIAACLAEVGAAAAAADVDIVVEPINHLQVGFNNSVGEVLDLIATTGSSRLHPMVDTIHMNVEETSLVQPIRDCGASLRHVHLCESNGAILGTGHIDFASVLTALDEVGFDDFASVKVYRKAEILDAARSSMAHLRAAGV